MARQLTSEAKKMIMNDASLYADICLILGVKAGSLSQLVYRNSARLTNHDVVLKISEVLARPADEILEETELSATV